MSERECEQLRNWLRETESDCESVLGPDDPDEWEEDHVEENDSRDNEYLLEENDEVRMDIPLDNNDAMEQGEEPVMTHNIIDRREFYIGKDKETKWYLETHMARTSRTASHNIIPRFHMPGPKGHAKNAKTHIQSFECIFDDDIVNKIVIYTNIYINKIKHNFVRDRDAKLTDYCEIRALFGMLFLAGVMKSSRRNVIEIFDMKNGTGVEAINVTMSERRFRFLMRCLRFDDIHSRNQRKSIDKLAAIREIFDMFLKNSQNAYNPSDYMSIDEQLVAFRGNCPFRQYIPSKSAKYGIKVFALVSASSFYTSNLEVYVGIQPDGPFKISNKPHDLVLRMTEPLSGSNRNITTDNWFVSLPLALALLEERKLTLIGTMRGNRREVPSNFLADKEREKYSSLFGYHEKATLVSYIHKPNKAVIALSTMHRDGKIDPSTNEERKPVIITAYNETKFGVDILDKMCHQYNTSRNSRRWPLTLFFHLMNVGGVNAINIYKANNNYENVVRREYLSTLAIELMKPAVHRRMCIENIPKQLKVRCKLFLGIEEQEPVIEQQRGMPSGSRCIICPRSADKKTRKTCDKCHNRVCQNHLKNICEKCYK